MEKQQESKTSVSKKRNRYILLFLIVTNFALLTGNLFWFFEQRGITGISTGQASKGPEVSPVNPPKEDPEITLSHEKSPEEEVNPMIELLEKKYVVRFSVGTSELSPRSQAQLFEIETALSQHSELFAVIEGHTDSQGSKAGNVKLSMKRAIIVAKYLEEIGVNSKRMKASGSGELYPIADNNTKEGREENRRVEISFRRNN
ncbi:MAG: OmpA family protein [Bacteroidota bacterium]